MWRAEKFLAQMNYRSAKARGLTPIHRPRVRKTTPSSISRIQRRSVGGDSGDIEVLMNGHDANVQLFRELFLHKFVEYNKGDEKSEVWRSANDTLARPKLEKHYSGADNIVNLHVKYFPRATHILKEKLVSVSSDYDEASVSDHIKVADNEGFNLVAVALVVKPREFTQYRERTQYVTYFQVQEDAVFDAPFPYEQPDVVFGIRLFPVSYKTVKEAEQLCRFTQPRFLVEHIDVADPLTRKRLTYRDEQLLFNEHLLMSGVEMQNIDARAHRTRYGDPVVLDWSATEKGDAFDETHPKANAPPRSFYTWLKTEKRMFEEMWDAFHQAREEEEEEEEEVPEQESTVILHTFSLGSVTDLVTLVTGYIEVLDPYYCYILSFLQRKFERRRIRLVQDEADGEQKTARERLDEGMTGPSYAEDSLEDGTCRQLLYWNINEELLEDILYYISTELYGDGPVNIARRYLTDGYRELEYKEIFDDDDEEGDEFEVAMMRFDTHDSRLEEAILSDVRARVPNLRVNGEFFEYTPGPQSPWPNLVLPGVQKTVPELFRHIIGRIHGQTIRQHPEQENSHIFENVTLASIVQFTTLIRTTRVRDDGSYEYEYEIVKDDDTLDFRILLKHFRVEEPAE